MGTRVKLHHFYFNRLLEAMVEEQNIEVIYNYEVKFVNLLPPTNFHK